MKPQARYGAGPLKKERMKKIFLLWFFGVIALGVRAQVPYDTVTVVDPQNFTLAVTIDTALVQVISRKANANRRINFQTIKNYSTPDITLSWLGVDLEDTTGTSAAYRDFFVTDNEGEVWFVDNAGSARKLYDPAQFQAVTISNDTLYISDGNFAIIPGSSASAIDSISFYGDTLRIYEGGSATPFKAEIISGGGVTGTGNENRTTYWDTDTTLAATSITYSTTEWDAVALTGALGLPSGTTLQRPAGVAGKMRFDSDLGDLQFYNGSAWRSLPESSANAFTAGQFIIANPAGILSDTTAAGALSMMGGTSGSGASPQVAYWSGASTLTGHANFLWDGTDLSVGTTSSSYTLSVGTGGVYVTPQSAAVTGVEGAGYWDSDAPKGMWWHDGTTFRATVWGDAPSWSSSRIPYSDGAKLVTSSNFTYDGITMHITGGDIEIETANRGIYNSAGNVGIEFNTSNPYIYAELGGGGSERYMEFEGPSARIGRMFQPSSTPSGFPLDNAFGIEAQAYSGLDGQDTYIVSERAGASNATHIRIIAANASDTNNGGSIFIQPGGSVTNGIYTGLSGVFQVNVPVDKDTIRTIPWKAVEVSGRNKLRPTIHLFHLDTTQTAIKTLFLEVDTVKYRIENIGAISTSTDGSGDVTVTHGMGTTPTAVLVTPTGTTPWIVSVHTIGATTFTVRFYDAAGAAVTSTAVTATWLGKT